VTGLTQKEQRISDTMARRRILVSALSGVALAAVALIYLSATAPRPGQPSGAPGAVPIQPPRSLGAGGPALRIGAPAPPFAAKRFGGGTLALADLRGKGVVVNFFASWCLPCREEARDLEATFQKYRAQGITFLAVDIQQDTWEDAGAFLKEFGISYPAIRDEDGSIAARYQMFGLPTTFFIDKDGILRAKYVGPFLGPEGLNELERRIAAVLPQNR
jgi:peroxiredoxin